MEILGDGFVDYFRKLARDNRREWFHEHKREYEEQVKRPFEALVATMIERLSAIEPELEIAPKDAIFRIARDIRFSKDKTPYKTHASAVICRGGRRGREVGGGLYLRFGADEASVATGVYMPDREQLHRIRKAIQDDPARFRRILRGKALTATFGELRGERNKRLPAEFSADVERLPWLAHKQFYVWVSHPAEYVVRDDLPQQLVRHFRAARPLNRFLREAID